MSVSDQAAPSNVLEETAAQLVDCLSTLARQNTQFPAESGAPPTYHISCHDEGFRGSGDTRAHRELGQ
jgi:hypothetical protein